MTTLVNKDGPTGSWLFGLHISVGVTLLALLALLALRIVVRLTRRPPPLPTDIVGLERKAAHLGHAALYALPIAVMAVGWAGVNLGGHTVKWFGVPLPTLLPATETWAGFDLDTLTETLHMWLAYIMLAVALSHVEAAFKHRWFDGHDVIRRMTFGGTPGLCDGPLACCARSSPWACSARRSRHRSPPRTASGLRPRRNSGNSSPIDN